jgi:ubiquitin C-terminal hydrolase
MEEKLQENEMTLCSSCSSKQKSIKTLKIQRFPKILVLRILTVAYIRIFISTLDLKRFSYVNGHKDTKLSTGVNFSEELHVTSASANPNDKAVYQLYGYIDHHGTSNFGHYIATCKHINTGCWHSISDTESVLYIIMIMVYYIIILLFSVSPVHGIETSSSNLVYVLFYQKM